MFDAADLSVFVDPDMPGYVSATISATPVGGLFGAAYGEAFGMVGGGSPALRVLSTVAVSDGDEVIIAGETYLVASIEQPLGPGSLKLLRLETA